MRHNHPTEIEPFGGAATSSGRSDPRSAVRAYLCVPGYARYRRGRSTRPLGRRLNSALPQRKISNSAAQGYSSYGNQIGLATGYVKEIYHPGYVAKRMEIGAVMGAAPRKDVIRETSDPGISSFFWAGVRAATESAALPVLPRFTPLPPSRYAG